MPTKFRGRAEIVCKREACVVDPSRQNVAADCLECAESLAAFIGLDERPIGEVKKKKAEKAKAEV